MYWLIDLPLSRLLQLANPCKDIVSALLHNLVREGRLKTETGRVSFKLRDAIAVNSAALGTEDDQHMAYQT